MKNKDIEKKIQRDIRFNIAVSEFGKKYKMNYRKNTKKLIFKKVAIIVLIIGLLGVGVVQAKNMMGNLKNRNPVYIVQSISEAIKDGYVENLNMEYLYSDGVGLKINSFFMSNNDMNFILDFKLNNKIKLNGNNLEYAYIVYNEKNEVYHVERGTNQNLIKEFIKNKKVKLTDNDIEPYFLTGQTTYITNTEDNIIVSTLMSARDYFPKAKKLYVKVVGIGYRTENGKYKGLSNSEWNIEINVPEKFYSEKMIEYKLKNNVNGINLEKMMISSTSTILVATIDGINGKIGNKNNISVVDENGNEYKTDAINFDGRNTNRIICQIPINKNMLTNKIYLKIITNESEKIIELEKLENR